MSLVGAIKDYNNLDLPEDTLPGKGPLGVQLVAKIHFKIINPDGTVAREWDEPSHSLNENFAAIIYDLWFQANFTWVDVYGYKVYPSGGQITTFTINAPAGNSTYGIVVGSGSPASGTNLATVSNLYLPIPNGTSAGQLQYEAVTVQSGPTLSGTTTSFVFYRNFINSSGGTVTVSEIGIIAYITAPTLEETLPSGTTQTASSDYVLISYDVPSTAITVQNGQTLQITYTFSVTT